MADIGCGLGWSSISLAKGFPDISVDGFDNDMASVEKANNYAEKEGV